MALGETAWGLMREARFLEEWETLRQRSPHATGFQSPAFVLPWYEIYGTRYRPLLVYVRDTAGLSGLWLLAVDPERSELVHAGTHQAEYHVWLALPDHDAAFLEAAWARLRQEISFTVLRFKYLPAASLVATLRSLSGMRERLVARLHSRPLARLDAAEIRASAAKNSNRSRFNRLKRLGTLDFRRLSSVEELDRCLDDFIAFYDFRQGAAHGTTPFRDDHAKRAFCRAVFTASTQETHCTVSTLDGRPIAALWGTITGASLQVGMLAYSPMLAEHSPGKLHIMQLSEQLLREGKEVLDLTPGGDPWKERFANTHDQVAEVLLYRSAAGRIRAGAADGVLAAARRGATRIGLPPSRLRRWMAAMPRATPANALRKVRRWMHSSREQRVYRGDRSFAARFTPDNRVAVNSPADLLCFEAVESWQTREAFLAEALARLERGDTAYTICMDGRLAHYGWMIRRQTTSFMTEVRQSIVFPAGSAAIYDAYTHPDYRGRGLYRATMCHMLHDVFADPTSRYAYLGLLADNAPSRHVIESLGFEYQGSLYWRRWFGRESKSADPRLTQAETADA